MIALFKKENHLPLVRIGFFFILFLLIQRSNFFLNWASYPASFWSPNGILRIFDAPIISKEWMNILITMWKITAIFSCIGLFYLFMAPLCFMLAFFIVNYSHSFGYQGHAYMPSVLLILVLAFSRAADHLSLDQNFFKRSEITSHKVNGMAHFNLKLIFCIVFFMSGLSKLLNSGLEWIFSDTLRMYFLKGMVTFKDINPYINYFPLGKILYDYPFLCQMAAAFTIFIEVFSPISLMSRRASLFFIPSLLLMQIIAVFAIGVNFRPYMLMYLVWLPEVVSSLARYVPKKRAPNGAP